MALGASSLSDAQLIAAILRTGTKGIDATKLAEEIIKMCGRFDTNDNDSLIGLANLSIPELMKIKGVGRVKAVQIQCICELCLSNTSIMFSNFHILKRMQQFVLKCCIPYLIT